MRSVAWAVALLHHAGDWSMSRKPFVYLHQHPSNGIVFTLRFACRVALVACSRPMHALGIVSTVHELHGAQSCTGMDAGVKHLRFRH